MCHFISGVIESQTTIDDLNKIGLEYELGFNNCDNDFVKTQLNKTEQYIIKRSKFCDCGTQLGLVSRADSSDSRRVEKSEIDKLTKKGWTDTKIKRWLTDRGKTIEKDKVKYDNIVNGVHKDIENWIQYINQLFNETKITHFGLLLHWYSGGVESERIKLKDRKKIRITDIKPDTLLKIEEDVVYDIVR